MSTPLTGEAPKTVTRPVGYALTNLLPALVEAQKAMGPLFRNANNPFYRSKYADLEQVVGLALPHLLNNGITFVQGVVEEGGYQYLETTLIHVSGERLSTLYPLHVGDKNDPQKLGSAVTYARRYSLMAALGLAPEDDDGNSNVSTPPTGGRATATPAAVDLPEHFSGLVELFRKKAWTRNAADKAAIQRFNVPVAELTKAQIKTWEKELAIPF